MAAGDVNTRDVTDDVDSGGLDTIGFTATASHRIVGIFPKRIDPNVSIVGYDFGTDGATATVTTNSSGPVTSGDSDVYSCTFVVTEVAQA